MFGFVILRRFPGLYFRRTVVRFPMSNQFGHAIANFKTFTALESSTIFSDVRNLHLWEENSINGLLQTRAGWPNCKYKKKWSWINNYNLSSSPSLHPMSPRTYTLMPGLHSCLEYSLRLLVRCERDEIRTNVDIRTLVWKSSITRQGIRDILISFDLGLIY